MQAVAGLAALQQQAAQEVRAVPVVAVQADRRLWRGRSIPEAVVVVEVPGSRAATAVPASLSSAA